MSERPGPNPPSGWPATGWCFVYVYLALHSSFAGDPELNKWKGTDG